MLTLVLKWIVQYLPSEILEHFGTLKNVLKHFQNFPIFVNPTASIYINKEFSIIFKKCFIYFNYYLKCVLSCPQTKLYHYYIPTTGTGTQTKF
jgi:hypothetical protein